MQLSWHFTLEDLTNSETATRHGLDNTPGKQELENLKWLAAKILEPIHDWFGPLVITSGFRCLELNRKLGSKDSSDHILGLAADFRSLRPEYKDPLKLCEAIARTKTLGFKQLVHEFGSWVHISGHGPTFTAMPKREVLTIDSKGVRVGLHPARPRVPKEKVA